MSHTPGPWKAMDLDTYPVVELSSGEWAEVSNPDDARLIAAAPDLLAALGFCEAADIARRGGDLSYEDDRIEQTARAAIAKAKGESA